MPKAMKSQPTDNPCQFHESITGITRSQYTFKILKHTTINIAILTITYIKHK